MSSNDPDVVLSAGFDQRSFEAQLSAIQAKIKKLQDSIAASQITIAQNEERLRTAQDQKDKDRFDRQVQMGKARVANNQANLAALLQQEQMFNDKIKQLLDKTDQLRKSQSSGGGSNSIFGSYSGAVAGFGYGIRSAASGIPGLRALSSLPLAGGFGGLAGLAGAGLGVGIAETIRGVTQLVGLYEDLAKKAFDLAQNHSYLQGTLSQTAQTFMTGLGPAMKNIQETETKVADWLDGHQNLVGNIAEQMGRLADASGKFVEHILMFVTQSPNIESALTKLAQRGANFTGRLANIIENITSNPLSPGMAIYAGAMANPKSGGSTQSSMADYKTAIDNSLVKFDNVDMTEHNKKMESIQRLKDELALKQQELRLAADELKINKELEDTIVAKEQAAKSLGNLQSQAATLAAIELDFTARIATLREKIAQDEVNKAKAKVSGLTAEAADYTIDPVKMLEKKIQLTQAQMELDKAKAKQDDVIGKDNIEIQDAANKLVEARLKAQRLALDESSEQQTRDDARLGAILAQIGAINALNAAEAGHKQNSSVAQVLSGQFPTGSDIFANATNSPLSQSGLDILKRMAAESGQANLQGGIQNAQGYIDLLNAEIGKSHNGADITKWRAEIKNAKDDIINMTQALIVNLQTQQALTIPGTEKWQSLEESISKAKVSMVDMQHPIKDTGQLMSATFEMLIHQSSLFRGSIGSLAGDFGRLGKSVFDFGNLVNPKTGDKATGILSGLSGAFGSAKGLLTQGLPIAGAIASSAMSIISGIHDLFTAAAKKMANQIATDVSNIVKQAGIDGKITDALNQLTAERTKAITNLSSKKGGQDQLNKLLPTIDEQIAQLQSKLKGIVDSFNSALNALEIGKSFSSLYNTVQQAEKQVKEFLDAVGQTPESMDKVKEFLALTVQQMSQDWQDSWNQTWDSWVKGAEDAAGNLISVDQEELNKIDDENKNFANAETQRTKDLAKLKSDYTKQQAQDAKNLASLQTQLSDLNAKEVTDIANIQNQGIATRQQTTQQSKAQQIADLQDANKKQRSDIAQQISDLQDVAAQRAQDYADQLQQMTDAEALAQTNHDNTISRIINETERQREAFLQKMDQLKQEEDFINTMNANVQDFLAGGNGLMVGAIVVQVNNTNASADEIANAVNIALGNIASNMPLQSVGN